MAAFVLLVQAVVLLIICYKHFFPNLKNQFYRFNKSTNFEKEKLNYFQEEHGHYTKSDSKEKGDDFERFVIKLFDFESKRFVLKEWRSDKYDDGIYPESNHYPDFEILLKTQNYDSAFAVECKYRSNWKQDNSIYWAKYSQIENYDIYMKQKNRPVFIVLGVGGTPKNPDEVYIFSLEDVRFQSKIYFKSMLCFKRINTNSRLYYDAKYKRLQ